MKEKMKLVEAYIIKTYKPEMIMSDMINEVIPHDSYDRFLFRPSEVQLKWLVAKLRFVVADVEYQKEIKRQDELDFHNWIYNEK